MPFDVEQETRSNSKDIQALTNTVTRVVTMQENAEKRHEEMMRMVSKAVSTTEELSQKMAETIGMQKDIKTLSENYTALSGDTRANRHDVQNALQGIKAIDTVNSRVTECATKIATLMEMKSQVTLIESRQTDNMKIVTANNTDIEALKAWRNKHSGATGMAKYVISGVWVILGGAVVIMAQHYFR